MNLVTPIIPRSDLMDRGIDYFYHDWWVLFNQPEPIRIDRAI